MKGKIVLLIPSLHYWEFANLLRTLVLRREISEALAREICELHLGAPLERAEPDERQILDVAFEYGATAHDAVYIALSLSRGIQLITAERTTTPWAVKLGDQLEPVR